MAGDCINNLRSALDHLIYAIASHEAAPQSPSDEDRLSFPITDSGAKFNQAVAGGRLGKISDVVRARIESLQPYNRPHPELPPLLRILRELNNLDKHRLLKVVYTAVNAGNVGLIGDSAIPPKVTVTAHHTEIEDGTEILSCVCDRSTPNMHFDRDAVISVVIAIWHGKRDPSAPNWTDRSELIALLSLLSEEVRGVIYNVSEKVL